MTTKKTTKKVQYEASVKVLGKTFTAKGKDIQTALEKLDPGNVAGMAIITIKKGKVSKDRVIPHVMAKRLFNTAGVSREAQIKNVSLMFDGI